jgi:hypothetical protein
VTQSNTYGTGRKPRAWKRRRKPTPQAPVVVMLAPTPTPIVLVPSPAAKPFTTADRARVAKWIRDRVVADRRDSCWQCRRPFAFGQKFIEVRGNETTVRFHTACHGEWLVKQEAAARRALGLLREAAE